MQLSCAREVLLVALTVLLSAGPDGLAQSSPTRAQGTTETGFETAAAGSFDKLETEIGTWTSLVGRTIVDKAHAKTGRHCLQLTGGQETSVSLTIANGVNTSGDLSFWAERWTSRAPFSFRIEKDSGDGWKEIFNGDRQVRVGREFLSHIKVPLRDATIKQLRFTCTSPPDTGILIDNVRFSQPVPMRVVTVKARHIQSPILLRNEVNSVVDVQVDVEGSLSPLTLTGLTATQMSGTDLISNLTIDVWATGVDSTGLSHNIETLRQRASLFGTSQSASLQLDGSQLLEPGANHFFLSARLPDGVDLSKQVLIKPVSVTIGGRQFSIETEGNAPATRLGYALRKAGDDGSRSYRIPGLATTTKGTLIAVYDIRRRGAGDLPGDIDVGMSRSTDGGQTWQAMQVIMDMGSDPQWNYDGVGDPAVLVDRNTGTIWVAGTWSHGNRSWNGSGPGLTPEETGQLMLVRSDDDGITWSKPINITEQVKRPDWCFILQGPGKGITMRDGTLVFAAQYQDPPDQRRLPHSTIIFSKDHGETWHVGTGAFDDTTEAQVVEVEPGVLMLNCRYNRRSARVVMTTRDLGQTWQQHSSSETALIEPRACMASLIDVDQEVGRNVGGWLLFANPDSLTSRQRLMIKASNDGGQTWPNEHRLLLDEGSSAYSCLTMIDAGTVGILYESSRALMTFQRVPLSDLTAEPIPATVSFSASVLDTTESD